MDKKVCTGCKVEKETTEFNKQKAGKFGIQPKCKNCQKEYRENNKESISEYYENNKQSISKQKKEYRENNKEKIAERKKEWYINNKQSILEKAKKYYESNKQSILEKEKKYIKQRSNTDPLFKLSYNIRTLIRNSLKRGGFGKNTKTANILGCSYDFFMQHIESKFEDWMSWDNYGKYNGELNYGFDIDHIIPVGSAKTEDDVIRLNHYTNLQPLCSYINRYVKKDKLNY